MGKVLVGAVAASFFFAACGIHFVADDVANIRFEGRLYRGGPATGYDIQAEDLTAAGSATEIHIPSDGATVYALSKVPVQEVAIMKAIPDLDSPYLIVFADGGTRPLERIPGFCAYVVAAPVNCEPPAQSP